MTQQTEFLQKLKCLLDEYDVSISFSVGSYSNIHGLYDEELVFDHHIDKKSFKEERWLTVSGWSLDACDIKINE